MSRLIEAHIYRWRVFCEKSQLVREEIVVFLTKYTYMYMIKLSRNDTTDLWVVISFVRNDSLYTSS